MDDDQALRGNSEANAESLDRYLDGADLMEEDADHPLGDDNLPPAARKCPRKLRAIVRRAHRNLGHCSTEALVRIMQTAKVVPEMIEYMPSTSHAHLVSAENLRDECLE